METTRLDTFIDAAFATTMLVISIGNIPGTFPELILAFKAIPSFLASFASITFIWHGHRKWSRRYRIENSLTILMSLGLVFVLIIYIYPLRLLFSSLFAWISGGFFPSEFSITSRNIYQVYLLCMGLVLQLFLFYLEYFFGMPLKIKVL